MHLTIPDLDPDAALVALEYLKCEAHAQDIHNYLQRARDDIGRRDVRPPCMAWTYLDLRVLAVMTAIDLPRLMCRSGC